MFRILSASSVVVTSSHFVKFLLLILRILILPPPPPLKNGLGRLVCLPNSGPCVCWQALLEQAASQAPPTPTSLGPGRSSSALSQPYGGAFFPPSPQLYPGPAHRVPPLANGDVPGYGRYGPPTGPAPPPDQPHYWSRQANL